DSIDERVIASFHPWLAMNDRGDLAFLANFEDGTAAIVLATVPEPSTVMLLSFSLAFVVFWRSGVRISDLTLYDFEKRYWRFRITCT
ncbi:MAG: PEP-CTERM sorting domain-containing protein, partial [Pirellulaceae bacterium]